MKAAIILANGFEDVEALATIDILKRSGILVDTYGLDQGEVITQYGHIIKTYYLLAQLDVRDYDFLIIPGGGAVVKILDKDPRITTLIQEFVNAKKVICAICAAPLLIGKLGYFKNLNYTCFPGCEETITDGKRINKGIVVTKKFITAKAMYYSIDFALAIIEKFQGKSQRDFIFKTIKGE